MTSYQHHINFKLTASKVHDLLHLFCTFELDTSGVDEFETSSDDMNADVWHQNVNEIACGNGTFTLLQTQCDYWTCALQEK